MPEEDKEQLLDRFAFARNQGKTVRIIYRADVPDDPVLPEELRRNGIASIVDGTPVSCDVTELRIELVVAADVSEAERPRIIQKIAWDRVIDLAVREKPGTPVEGSTDASETT